MTLHAHRLTLLLLRLTLGLAVGFCLTGCPETILEPAPEAATAGTLSPAARGALTQFNRGAALLEQYQYSQAAQVFQVAQFSGQDAA